jgi:hypothetical protein
MKLLVLGVGLVVSLSQVVLKDGRVRVHLLKVFLKL